MVDLQMKKLKLDQDRAKAASANGDEPMEVAEGQVLSRNDLLERLIGNRDQKSKD
jgi:hypothetical protein